METKSKDENMAQSPAPTWLQSVAVSVLSWLSIGVLGGASYLTYFVPTRFSQIDTKQQAIIESLTELRIANERLVEEVKKLSERLVRVEAEK